MFAQRSEYTALYRFFNPSNNDHVYTKDCQEKDNILRNGGFNYEGIAGYVATRQIRRTIPLYRMLLENGEHFYTTDLNEVNNLRSNYNNRDEGVAGYVSDRQTRDTLPFYRLLGNNRHFYTTSVQERDVFLRNGGIQEDIAGYLFTFGQNSCDFGTNPGNNYQAPTLYTGANFDGQAMTIDRDMADLNNWNGSQQIIRSIRVPQGWSVRVYARRNYGGASFDVRNDITFVPGDRWFNRIRSIRVYRGNYAPF